MAHSTVSQGDKSMAAANLANRIFDPKNANYMKKMKQNATFCNKPPPLAPPAEKNRRITLKIKELQSDRFTQILETGNTSPLHASVSPCLRGCFSSAATPPKGIPMSPFGIEPAHPYCYRVQPQLWAEIYSVKSRILAIMLF
jgi:hypothetical protein